MLVALWKVAEHRKSSMTTMVGKANSHFGAPNSVSRMPERGHVEETIANEILSRSAARDDKALLWGCWDLWKQPIGRWSPDGLAKSRTCRRRKSATAPLGTEWACPQVLCPIPGASVLSPKESLKGPEPKFTNLSGLRAVPLGLPA